MAFRFAVERHAPHLAGVALAALTLVSGYLPMTDLPMHEGVVGLLRHFGDESYMPKGLYVLNFGHPNQLFYVLALGLAYVVSTATAVKIVVAASQFLIFVGGAWLADYVGRSRWGALLLTPLALGFTYYWGLVANLIGYAGLLLALPMLDRDAKRPSAKGALRTTAVLVGLFFAHESIFVSAAAVVGMLALFRRSWLSFALALLPSIFAAAIAIGHALWQERFFTPVQASSPVTYMRLTTKIESIPNVLFGSHETIERLLLTLIAALALGVFFAARFKEPRERPAAEPVPSDKLGRAQAALFLYRFELIALVHLLAYFIVPFTWNGATLIHERFFGPAWALVVVVATPRSETPRLGKFIGAVLPVAVLALSWPQFVDATRTHRDLDAIIARIPKNSAVTQTTHDRVFYRTRVYSVSTGPARIVAVRGGRVGLTLTFSPISPVQTNPAYRWDEYTYRITFGGSGTLRPAYDLDRWEWIVVHSRDPEIRRIVTEAFVPDAELVMERGEWVLFHSTHTIVPLLSAEPPPPPPMETMSERVARLGRDRRGTAPAKARPAPPPLP